MLILEMCGVENALLHCEQCIPDNELALALFINDPQPDTGTHLGAKNPVCIASDCDLQFSPTWYKKCEFWSSGGQPPFYLVYTFLLNVYPSPHRFRFGRDGYTLIDFT